MGRNNPHPYRGGKMNMQSRSYLSGILKKAPGNIRPVITTIILSIFSAFSAVFFMYLLKKGFSHTYEKFAEGSALYFITASFILISVCSLISGLLMYKYAPETAGSGIPQVKASYWKDMGIISFRSVIIKFFAGIFSIVGGNSLGREGPSVYIGSGIATNLDTYLGGDARNKRAASLIGASAGLAAAFNTPLAAITFVIEEIIGEFNNRYLGKVVLSSVIGAFVVFAVMGRQPAFSLPSVGDISWFHYAIVPVVAVISSFLSVAFQKNLMLLRRRTLNQKKMPGWLMPVAGGLMVWVIGNIIFFSTGNLGIFGLGYNELSSAMSNNINWRIAGILAGAKLLATLFSYGFGGCGGIFAPSLFIGGFTGFFIGGIAEMWIPLTPEDHIVLAAIGMSTFLGVLINAPMTSVLIVFEMTHQFHMVPGLMLGMIISQMISLKFTPVNIYDSILVQDGHELHKIRPPVDLKSWRNLEIKTIANPNITFLSSLETAEMKNYTERYPYKVIPVIINGKIKGMTTRKIVLKSIENGTDPEIFDAGTCTDTETVNEVGNRFVESELNVLIVIDDNNKPSGIITLHDLIRAQAAIQS